MIGAGNRAAHKAVGVGVLIAGFLSPLGARADNSEDLIRTGVELRRQGKNADALAAFQRADSEHSTPRTQAQIGLAFQALGHWVEAEAAIERALASGSDSWIATNIQALRGALEKVRDHLAWIDVDANVEGAELWLNGAFVSKLPLAAAARTESGFVVLEVRAPGYDSVRRRIEVAPTIHAREVVQLVARTTPNPSNEVPVTQAKPSAPADLAPKAGEPRAPEPQAPMQPNVDPGRSQRVAGWITLAGSAAFLGGGAVFHWLREHDANIYNDDSRCNFGDESREQRCGEYRQTAETAQTLAIVGYVGGGIGAVAGAVLLLTAPSTSSAKSAHVGCGVVGIRGITCGGTF